MIDWIRLRLVDSYSNTIASISFFHDHLISFVVVITLFTLNSIVLQIFQIESSHLIVNVNTIERIWTVVPALILIAIALPSMSTLYYSEKFKNCSLSLKVSGNQWYWAYSIKDSEISFLAYISQEPTTFFRLLETDNVLQLPRSSWIRALISSNDVIHAWALPSNGVKVDAVPGRINYTPLSFSSPGIVFGQCSEICGANHRFIPISILVK